MKKDCKSVCKKRKYAVRRTKKTKKLESEIEKCDVDVDVDVDIDADADDEEKQKDIYKPGSNDGQVKRFVDELSECEENVAIQDSHDILKSNSPEHQTAESESGKFSLKKKNKRIPMIFF